MTFQTLLCTVTSGLNNQSMGLFCRVPSYQVLVSSASVWQCDGSLSFTAWKHTCSRERERNVYLCIPESLVFMIWMSTQVHTCIIWEEGKAAGAKWLPVRPSHLQVIHTHTHIITITAFRNNTDTLEFWRRKKEIFSFERQRWRTWNSCPCCYLLAGRDLNHLLNMRATKIIKLSQSWKRNKRRKKRNVGGRETTDK